MEIAYQKNAVVKNYTGMDNTNTFDIVDDVTESGSTIRVESNRVIVIASQAEHDRLQSLGYVTI